MDILRHLSNQDKYHFVELDEGGYSMAFFDARLNDDVVWLLEKEQVEILIKDLALVIRKKVNLEDI